MKFGDVISVYMKTNDNPQTTDYLIEAIINKETDNLSKHTDTVCYLNGRPMTKSKLDKYMKNKNRKRKKRR